jgi:hypothetical protein
MNRNELRSAPCVIAISRTPADEIHNPPARWWPLVAIFLAFVALISGCKKPFPDYGEPVIAESPATSVQLADALDSAQSPSKE